jgi:hypothetical protein
MKYKNKNGIELSYEGHEHDTSVQLIKEILKKAIEIGDKNKKESWLEVKRFLTENFSLNFKSRYEGLK